MPPSGRDRNPDMFIEIVKEDILSGITKSKGSNIKTNKKTIKSLLQNYEIVIRPADKGSGIVIMDKGKYIQKVEEDLNRSKTYKRLTKNQIPVGDVTNKV